MDLPIKIIEIVYSGSNSVLGTICEELKNDTTTTMKNYCWVILVYLESFEMIKQQCEDFLKLPEYVIVERRSAIIKSK